MKTNYRKIDIFLKSLSGFWAYECSTNWAKTCKEAKKTFMTRHCLDASQVKTSFAK